MILSIAWRNIWRNKVRSITIMLSIALGLFSGLLVLSLYQGMMNSRIRSVIESEVGHIQLHHPKFKNDYEPEFVIKRGEDILNQISKLPEVKFVAPRSISMGMLSTANGTAGVQINGVVPGLENNISQLKSKIQEGDDFDTLKRNQIMIGRKLAGKLKVRRGSRVVLTFTDPAGEIIAGAFKIRAIYKSENTQLDESYVFIMKNDLNRLLNIDPDFHEIVILLHHNEDVKPVNQKLKKIFSSLRSETWMEISPETELMTKTVDQYSYIIMIIIMMALAFGIINTMLMAILERTREIGMMLALGTNRLRIFLLVLYETVILTLAGTPFGLFASWLLISYFNKQGLDLSYLGSTEMLNNFGFGTMIYPEFPKEKLSGIVIIVIGTALISSLFPALKAIRMQPVDALRK
ncbi:FtsX-like permease family protein [Daejeonella sp. H1SJ63]|uniref:ABC transporter permease n=1 Tax=Daejeonella sp. H1SJ63 TaxID=3034145 RepID=UPI0023ED6641|nr:FtsX-like permease family protein [Daejeonella sp. H1SJ63]